MTDGAPGKRQMLRFMQANVTTNLTTSSIRRAAGGVGVASCFVSCFASCLAFALFAALAAAGCGSGELTSSGGTGGASVASGGANGVGSGGASGTGGAGPATGTGCDPACNFAQGIAIGCEKRFFYGVNYAWSRFAGDFGGTRGVAANMTTVQNQLSDMRANGVDTVRWWVWPNLNTGNVVLDAGGTPTGLGGTVVNDVNAALALAAQIGLHVQFTLFSFDNFRADTANTRSIRPIVVDAAKRAALMTVAVQPFVRAVTQSPNATAVVGWDIINEPEWAISGSNGYGDPAYTPQTNLQTVTQAEMEALVADTIAAIRAENNLPITVGGTAAKWAHAWSRVNVDYYTIHIYDWINTGGWPYDRTPAQLGLTGKPVVMGEFPLTGLTGVSYDTLVNAWFRNGFAGAMGWAVTDNQFNWAGTKTNVKVFSDAKGCVVRY